MNGCKTYTLLAALLCVFTGGCSLAPQTMPLSARTIGEGNIATSIDFVPSPAARVQRGISNRLDLGAQIENVLITLFGKYTFWESDKLTAAIYTAATVGPRRRYSARSLQVGPMFSYTQGLLETTLAFRYNTVDYTPSETDNFGTDALGIRVLSDNLDDYYTADLMLSLKLGDSPIRLKTGVTCTSYTLGPEDDGVNGCVPIIGIFTSTIR